MMPAFFMGTILYICGNKLKLHGKQDNIDDE